jgi:hypothetical protein
VQAHRLSEADAGGEVAAWSDYQTADYLRRHLRMRARIDLRIEREPASEVHEVGRE